MSLISALTEFRVLPVITATDVESTVSLARALSEGGMKALEITLRTDAALEAMVAVREAVPELVIGSGTIVRPEDLHRAIDAGCRFHVSPGLTPRLLDAAREAGAEMLPGIATPSEIMLGVEYGLSCFKLFPAVPVGGIGLLKALAGPFQGVAFCPTGGLNPDNFRSFLALPNVVCCGGSWMVAPELVKARQWNTITVLASQAMADG
jgi:2-dehydro-3-deoxyphosphogluconate aldolase/(4S)-4-hydroxy-2-oxoglutarate aldolase